MTIQQVIDDVDLFKPNQYTIEQKISWLSQLDGQIYRELIVLHYPLEEDWKRIGWQWPHPLEDRMHVHPCVPYPEDGCSCVSSGETFKVYDQMTDMGRELLVPEPYAQDIYRYWLMSQMDIGNHEQTLYAQDHTMFNTALATYSDHYTRTHLPVTHAPFARF